MNTDAPRWPRLQARELAEEILARLKPATERIEIAGSLRRQLPTVGDIEIVFIPKLEDRPFDLISTEPVDVTEEAINLMVERDYLRKRPSIIGSYAWGPMNKLALHAATGIPVDLFATTPLHWVNTLFLRTGGKETIQQIAMAANRKGWSFEAYGAGFRKLDNTDAFVPQSERDIYQFLGLPYQEPEQRA